MSISAMSEAKLVRERPDKRAAKGLEKRIGLGDIVARDQNSEENTPKPSGVPENIASRLVRWIPTETITLYLAFVALFDPLQAESVGADLCTSEGFVGRWGGFLAFAVFTPLAVILIHLARVRSTQEPFRWPVFEMAAASAAFVAWAFALPDSPLLAVCGYKPAVGGFLVLASTVVIGLVAEALGKDVKPEDGGGDDGAGEGEADADGVRRDGEDGAPTGAGGRERAGETEDEAERRRPPGRRDPKRRGQGGG